MVRWKEDAAAGFSGVRYAGMEQEHLEQLSAANILYGCAQGDTGPTICHFYVATRVVAKGWQIGDAWSWKRLCSQKSGMLTGLKANYSNG